MVDSTPPAPPALVLAGPCQLPAAWLVPPQAVGCVVFAHAADSPGEHARNLHLAQVLHSHGLATLLLQLLQEPETDERKSTDDTGLLAERLQDVLQWVHAQAEWAALPLGVMASDKGAAAALIVAAQLPRLVSAIVTRGGRPDTAINHLTGLLAPTLMLVGAKDPYVLRLNRAAALAMPCTVEVRTVVRATHHFEEPGTLDLVASAAAEWFKTWFRHASARPAAPAPPQP
jgi:putative phosphoribosyl transferase